MPIRKRGRGWQIDVQVGNQRARQTVATKATAIEVERKLREDLERERAGLIPRRTLADALAEYLTTSAPALKAYDSMLSKARMIRPHLDRPIERIAEAAAAITREGAGRTPATVNRRLALLRRLGNLAYQWGWVDSPLGLRVKLLPERQERHIYLSLDQVAALSAACEYEGARDAIWLAACTGLRRSELFSLGPENWRDGALWLATSKSGRPRLVSVPADAHEICGRLPLQVTDGALRLDFERARERCGMAHLRFHDLRHTYASWAVAAGVDLQVLRKLMGHASIQMTSRYAHLQDRQLHAATEQMQSKRRSKI